MLAQITIRHILVFAIAGISLSVAKPSYCSNCEEEIWEEIPCNLIPSSTSTSKPPTSTIPPPITQAPTTYTTTTTAAPVTVTSTTTTTTTTTPSPIVDTTAPSGLKQCYCDCKLGCREFCRKVMLTPNSRKQISQVSRSAQKTPGGVVEIKHLHQRKFVPTKYGLPYVPGGGNSITEKPSPCAVEGSYEDDIPCEGGEDSTSPPMISIPLPPIISNPYPRPQPQPRTPSLPAYRPPVYNAQSFLDSSGFSIDELTNMMSIPYYPMSNLPAHPSPPPSPPVLPMQDDHASLPSPLPPRAPLPSPYMNSWSTSMSSIATPSNEKTSYMNYQSCSEQESNKYPIENSPLPNAPAYTDSQNDMEGYVNNYVGLSAVSPYRNSYGISKPDNALPY